MAQFIAWADRHMVPLSKMILKVPEQTPEPVSDFVLYDLSSLNIENITDIEYRNNDMSLSSNDESWGGPPTSSIDLVDNDGVLLSDYICFYYSNINIFKYQYITFETATQADGPVELADGFGFVLINNGTSAYSKKINKEDIVYNNGKLYQFSLANAQDVDIVRPTFGFEDEPSGTTVTHLSITKITLTNTKLEDLTLYDSSTNPVTNLLAQNCKFYDSSTGTFVSDETFFKANNMSANANWNGLDGEINQSTPATIAYLNTETDYIDFITNNICIYYNESNIDISKYNKIQISMKADSNNNEESMRANHTIALILNETKIVVSSNPTFSKVDPIEWTIIWEYNIDDIVAFDSSMIPSIESYGINLLAPTIGGGASCDCTIKLIA